MDNEYLKVGTILKPVGLHGEFTIFSTTTFKDIRYKKGNILFLFFDDEYHPFTVKSFRVKNDKLDIISLEELDTPDALEPYLHKDIFAKKDYKILDKDEYFYADLIDSIVINQDNIEVGKVVDILEYPSQTTLKIKNSNNEYVEIPFIDVFIIDVDIKNKIIRAHTIEGMI